MNEAYTVKAVKNCRNYIKKCYLLNQLVDDSLIESLNEYGILEVIDFSAFSPLAKPCFKIKCFDELEISGVVNGRELFIVIAKHKDHKLFDELENHINYWFENAQLAP